MEFEDLDQKCGLFSQMLKASPACIIYYIAYIIYYIHKVHNSQSNPTELTVVDILKKMNTFLEMGKAFKIFTLEPFTA